jgi:hypothetical protein
MAFPLSLAMILGLATVGDGPQGSDKPVERLRAMRAMADGVTTVQISVDGRQKLERLAEPVYRFSDPARNVSDGTVWAWCHSGRPAALVTLTKHHPPARQPHWLSELTSLATGPIAANIEGFGAWQPSGAGVVMHKFPKAPLPADDASTRLRQMKDLVRQIKAHENFKPREDASIERYQLRVLPQPVHRYEDAKSGVIDGGLFIIAYGQNPEIALLVEATREGPSQPAWHFGCARIAIAEVHVDFDNKELWSHKGGNPSGPDDTYCIFMKPIAANE